MTVLVTGGAGYIGSHTVIALLENHYDVLILDNLSNASDKVIARLKNISGQNFTFIQGDIRDRSLLKKIFYNYDIETVIHFAGLKAVDESVEKPILYYENNVTGSLILIEEMLKAQVFNIIFSSSATVYGDPQSIPITEDMPVGKTTNPYGTSKYMVERIYQDIQKAQSQLSVTLLRYFNPIGAHHSGQLGEDPNEIPNNLMPYICQVAVGKLAELSIFGDDYPTQDGTGVRDYIHVIDLAEGHLKAMQKHQGDSGVHIYNLGTGEGYSVLDIVKAFSAVNAIDIPYKITPRRAGDIAICYADPQKAKKSLEWQAQYTLTDMMRDAWNWQKNNPDGYQ